MARRSIELVSPGSVYNRVVFGVVISVVAYFWPVQTEDGTTIRLIAIGAGIVLFLLGWTAVKNPMLAVRYAYNPRRTVLRLIEEWKPEPARLESEYEKSLHRFLKERLPFVKITRQYGSASDFAIVCQGAVDVSENAHSGGEITYTVEWIDTAGVKHTVYGARSVTVTQLKAELRDYPFLSFPPDPKTDTDNTGKPYREGLEYTWADGSKAILKNGKWQHVKYWYDPCKPGLPPG